MPRRPSMDNSSLTTGALPSAPGPFEDFAVPSQLPPNLELDESFLSRLTCELQSETPAAASMSDRPTSSTTSTPADMAPTVPMTTSLTVPAHVASSLPSTLTAPADAQAASSTLLNENESAMLTNFLHSLDADFAELPSVPSLGLPTSDLPLPPLASLGSSTFLSLAPSWANAASPSSRPGPSGASGMASPTPPVKSNDTGDEDSTSDATQGTGTGTGRRKRHIISEQRRRNQIREGFTKLSELLDAGRGYGARALGLNSGAGTGVEDEELDDRTDTEEDLLLGCDEEEIQRRKRNAQRRARSRAMAGKSQRGRGRGRGRGGSAGGAGSKSAVLFQVIDLLDWLQGRNATLERELHELDSQIHAAHAQATHMYRRTRHYS
ncbi:helix-loop-helix dna-binding domain-containing protein [Malassezia pachydermatis]|uniref:Helix-loop-helix dna-binding domain-containing protein n=1 Tax=Malassezia pachydermatis TaxID=77020 RepID=A0A0M9VPA1_9BASI|nr:helix-loop-helix dna-binding domain-containing protein [Malassezia pachydermatis]KOS14215.1 helix-loop-helix dna-binding domain-containing protein [Malassezia pachydermatis]